MWTRSLLTDGQLHWVQVPQQKFHLVPLLVEGHYYGRWEHDDYVGKATYICDHVDQVVDSASLYGLVIRNLENWFEEVIWPFRLLHIRVFNCQINCLLIYFFGPRVHPGDVEEFSSVEPYFGWDAPSHVPFKVVLLTEWNFVDHFCPVLEWVLEVGKINKVFLHDIITTKLFVPNCSRAPK